MHFYLIAASSRRIQGLFGAGERYIGKGECYIGKGESYIGQGESYIGEGESYNPAAEAATGKSGCHVDTCCESNGVQKVTGEGRTSIA